MALCFLSLDKERVGNIFFGIIPSVEKEIKMEKRKLTYASPELCLTLVDDADMIRTSVEGEVGYENEGSGNIQDW